VGQVTLHDELARGRAQGDALADGLETSMEGDALAAVGVLGGFDYPDALGWLAYSVRVAGSLGPALSMLGLFVALLLGKLP